MKYPGHGGGRSCKAFSRFSRERNPTDTTDPGRKTLLLHSAILDALFASPMGHVSPGVVEERPKEKEAVVKTRKGHTKSRDGCLSCKARHVRCDQGKPIWCVESGFASHALEGVGAAVRTD